MNKGRLEAFADGVFAIVITLLILEIKVPGGEEGLFPAMLKMFPHFIAYFISFIAVGVYWVSHHIMMSYVHKTTRTFLWLNLGFMMFVSIIPFTAAVLGEHSTDPNAILLYSINHVIIGIFANLVWHYAVKYNLLEEKIGPHTVNSVSVRNMVSPVIYVATAIIAYMDTVTAFALFFIVPLVHIAPFLFDFKWLNKIKSRWVRKWVL